jgi:carboxylate-amine ligase
MRAGTLRCANAFGTGLADDKLTNAYVEAMIGFYLEEAPILRAARSYDLGDRAQRAQAIERLDELVVKPRHGLGGTSVLIGERADAAQLTAARERIEADPSAWIAQETVAISTCPTIVDGELVERHVDLRPFALSAPEPQSVTGALTRVAFDAGEMVVNSSRNGGGKDTWIAPEPSETDSGR